MKARGIKRVYVRRYRDTGQVVAYCDWSDGSRTEASAKASCDWRKSNAWLFDFGEFMHAIFARAKRQGLDMERETW